MPAELSNKNTAGAATSKTATPATNPANVPAPGAAGTLAPGAAAAPGAGVNLSNAADPAAALTSLLNTLVNGQTEMLSKINEQGEKIVNLSNTVATLQTEKADAKKTAYTDRLKALAQAGSLTAAEVERETKVGEAMGWDLSNLAIFDGRKAVDFGNRSKGIASGAAPSVEGVTPNLSEDDIKQGVEYLLKGKVPAKKQTAAA